MAINTAHRYEIQIHLGLGWIAIAIFLLGIAYLELKHEKMCYDRGGIEYISNFWTSGDCVLGK